MEQYQKIIGNYLRLLWGGRWWIGACAVLAFAVAVTVASRMPDEYEAEAILMPDYTKLNAGFSSPADASVGDVLRSAKNRILTYNTLAHVIEVVDPYPYTRAVYGDRAKEVAINRLRASLDIVVNGQSQTMEVRFRHSGGEHAAQIAAETVNTLARAFADETRLAVLSTTAQVNDFVTSETAGRLRTLQDAEKHLREFEDNNLGRLPQDRSENYRRKEALLREIQTLKTQQQRNREEIERLKLEQVQQEEQLRRAEASNVVISPDVQVLRSTLADLQSRLTRDLITYQEGSQHIKTLREQIAQAEKDLAEREAEQPEAPESSAAEVFRMIVRNNVARQERLAADIEAMKKRIEEAGSEAQVLDDNARKGAENATEYTRLQREVDKARGEYQLMQNRSQNIELGTLFNQEHLKAPLNVEQEAIVPKDPMGPRRFMISFAGLIGGLAVGVGITFARLVLSSRVRATEELRRLMPGAVVVTIPEISGTGIRVGRFSFALVAVAVLLVLFAASFGILAIREGLWGDLKLIRPILDFQLPKLF